MRRSTKVVVVLCFATVLACAAWARGDAVSEKRRAQSKLLAYRAARAEAMRKLAERIYGLSITSQTSVRDFVTESDTIQTAMMAFLQGAREVGKPKYMEDGTCEVTMEVALQEVVLQLKKLYKEYSTSKKITIQDIEKITLKTNQKTIRETGMGAPRPELMEDPPVEVGEASIESFSYLTGPAKEYWMAHCTARGRLMAVRAARLDALRRLAERINGLMISSETSVRDFVAESDAINTELNAFIRGAKETHITYHSDELIVEVEMQVTLRELVAGLKKWYSEYYKGNKIKVQDLEKLTVRTRDKVIREIGMGVPPEQYLKDVDESQGQVLKLAQQAPAWVSRTLRATGSAAIDTETDNLAQAKLMAMRAAELDARRKLAERIDGLMITSNTSVRDFVAMNDEIETSMLTFQQGARVVEGSQKMLEDGTCEVTVEIDLKPLWNSIIYYERKLSLTIR